MQTTEQIVQWLVSELTKAIETQVLERMRLALGGLVTHATAPHLHPTPRPVREPARKRVSPNTAEAVIDTRRTWTVSQLVKAGGAISASGASHSLSKLEKAGKLRRVKRGLYEVIGPAPMAAPNGVHTGV